MLVSDRFLARLTQPQPAAQVLKGGLALEMRLGNQARTTKDMDVLLTTPYDELRDLDQALVGAALLDMGDWFQIEVERPAGAMPVEPIGGVRFQVRGLLDRRRFEAFHTDVGRGDRFIEAVEILTTPALLDFAAFGLTRFPVVH